MPSGHLEDCCTKGLDTCSLICPPRCETADQYISDLLEHHATAESGVAIGIMARRSEQVRRLISGRSAKVSVSAFGTRFMIRAWMLAASTRVSRAFSCCTWSFAIAKRFRRRLVALRRERWRSCGQSSRGWFLARLRPAQRW